ncbi:hypothetical protein AXF42_Ash020154 [Apostasia shenzhenica]|uniref:Uncharacterized protein n=1 Tax=Apostasia shenzhenica TaxID=1088818 RepID=A0A2H9ZVT6_9ASPA|nr:hypothetical protein AXF42_Ash020154 [Apostasia shenzhenica]
MAEISKSDPLNPNPNPPQIAFSIRRTTKPGRKRVFVTLSVFFSFLVGLLFLLKSTEIYRSPLPFSSIESLSLRLRSEPPAPPCRLQAVFLRPGGGGTADRLARLISDEVDKSIGSIPSRGSCGRNYALSVTVDSGNGACERSGDGESCPCYWPCGGIDVLELRNEDGIVDELLDSALGGGGQRLGTGGKIYTVVVAGGKGEFVPVGLDGSVVLSFNLLNANPNDWVYDCTVVLDV